MAIPYRVEGGRSFFARQEVRDLSSVLAAIDDPQDQVSLVAALRSTAFGCSDEDIYLHVARAAAGSTTAAAARRKPRFRARAFDMLLDLNRMRAGASLPRLVRATGERLRMIEVALAGWDGQQAAANLAKLVEQSRAFASGGGGGLEPSPAGSPSNEVGATLRTPVSLRRATTRCVLSQCTEAQGPEYSDRRARESARSPTVGIEPGGDRAAHRLHLRVSSGKARSRHRCKRSSKTTAPVGRVVIIENDST